ncbi:MAG: hypothetical protein ABH811_00080 [archaeon]
MILLGNNTEHGFKLEAVSEGKPVGKYELSFDKSGNISHGFINSRISDKHIPRNLICAAGDKIQDIANKECKKIKHDEYLVTDDSKKLSCIFEKLGYEKRIYPECIVVSRTYQPEIY